jgi:hypothetical protein
MEVARWLTTKLSKSNQNHYRKSPRALNLNLKTNLKDPVFSVWDPKTTPI